jgi:hypothetical protein
VREDLMGAQPNSGSQGHGVSNDYILREWPGNSISPG